MAKLSVAETNVPSVIKLLKSGEWLAPEFQRDFVWNNAAVISLINSVIDSRPIGMVTLWEQEDNSQLELEHISIPDWDADIGRTGRRYFGNNEDRPGRYFAVLDGRQRSTAIALVFGGLKAESGLYRNAGEYFLDVTAIDTNERVKYLTTKDINNQKLNMFSNCVSKGLFPLKVNDPDSIYEQWMDYLQAIKDAKFYPKGILPDDATLDTRNNILKNAFSGIINTKLAVYTVPKNYNLAEICEIFETLNTTGTKVSTVDLIHSWLYNDTHADESGPLLLRDKIDELGDMDGAVGWASSGDRPELIAQFVAATHVALDNKPAPRPIAKGKQGSITSVKSPDLIAIPSLFWKKIFAEEVNFARAIGDFQLAAAGGYFSLQNCPYPASGSVYVALRWYLDHDLPADAHWTRQHLDSLFSAFFWRNVLSNRYDQGFLSQIGTDIKDMKEFLNSTPKAIAFAEWRVRANSWLDGQIKTEIEEGLPERISSDGSQVGALRRASVLLLISHASKDAINHGLDISYGSENLNLHHIYPKDWCRNNATGPLSKFLNKDIAQRDWVNSPANLIPMHRTVNAEWRKKNPGQYLHEKNVEYTANEQLWQRYFVTKEMFDLLYKGADGLVEFWQRRAKHMASVIAGHLKV